MRHTIELLLCSTIGAYCVWRCYAVLPLAIAEAHALVHIARERTRRVEEALEVE
jgi:hypothetical protein